MLRMQIFCETPKDVLKIFAELIYNDSTAFQILRFKPRFGTFLRDMIINYNWQDKMICECQIKLGEQPFTFND